MSILENLEPKQLWKHFDEILKDYPFPTLRLVAQMSEDMNIILAKNLSSLLA